MTQDLNSRTAQQFLAGWGAMDFNGHLANTAYLDLAADARMSLFAERGFPAAEFRRLAIGPVIRRDELEYFREIHLHETITVTCALAGMSADGSRFIVENEFYVADGPRAAVVRSTGGWLDHKARRLVPPPAALLAAFASFPRTPDYTELPPVPPRPEK